MDHHHDQESKGNTYRRFGEKVFPESASEGFSFSRSSAGAEMSFPSGTGGSGGEFPRGLILCAGAVDESP